MDTLEEFLRFIHGGGWDKIESYFYNLSEDQFVERAIEEFNQSRT